MSSFVLAEMHRDVQRATPAVIRKSERRSRHRDAAAESRTESGPTSHALFTVRNEGCLETAR